MHWGVPIPWLVVFGIANEQTYDEESLRSIAEDKIYIDCGLEVVEDKLWMCDLCAFFTQAWGLCLHVCSSSLCKSHQTKPSRSRRVLDRAFAFAWACISSWSPRAAAILRIAGWRIVQVWDIIIAPMELDANRAFSGEADSTKTKRFLKSSAQLGSVCRLQSPVGPTCKAHPRFARIHHRVFRHKGHALDCQHSQNLNAQWVFLYWVSTLSTFHMYKCTQVKHCMSSQSADNTRFVKAVAVWAVINQLMDELWSF